ncbi:GGDEF domain-containing protein [Cyanobium sp. Morenito 9A2]|uniref:sensor domain-containing diguanylate cyclase n=1 Tax=Cyanobium sp. Morenito 9A2 TaxID=2823718 RepID=UPI0020CFAAED|nr:GGDEF domain-containing protein [Cyanobium sp. Morenito 9A2]MCP9850972.1 GGDEF domain-containing protein [Cyanobium sp. Morenito 9A2]
MTLAGNPIQSNLAEEVNRRLVRIMALVGLLGSALIAASTGTLALIAANRNIVRQSDQISAAISTFLQAEQNGGKQQRMVQLYRSQPLSSDADMLDQLVVFDGRGRVLLSSRPSLLGQSLNDLLDKGALGAGADPATLRCFTQPSSGCRLADRSFHLPWQSTQTEWRVLKPLSFDASPREQRYLVLMTFNSEATNLLVFQQVVLLASLSILILGSLLTVLTLTLKQSLLPGLHRVAETDGLTGLANRRTFMEISEKMLNRGLDEGLPFVLTVIDIDFFKRINDTHGHVCGDAVLRGVAQQIRSSLRGRDLVGRLGGEEFGLLLPSTSAMADSILERVRRQVEASSIDWEGESVRVTISLGAASSERLDHQLDHLYAAADTALYGAKEEGRNRVRWATVPNPDSSAATSPPKTPRAERR